MAPEVSGTTGIVIVETPLPMALVIFRELTVVLPWLDGSQAFYDQVSPLFTSQPKCSGQLYESPQTMSMLCDLAAGHGTC